MGKQSATLLAREYDDVFKKDVFTGDWLDREFLSVEFTYGRSDSTKA